MVESKAYPGRKRKRNAEGNLTGSALSDSVEFVVKTGPLPNGLQSIQVVTEPTGVGSPEGSPIEQGRPETGHVAEEPTSVAEAFWALSAGYMVWYKGHQGGRKGTGPTGRAGSRPVSSKTSPSRPWGPTVTRLKAGLIYIPLSTLNIALPSAIN